MEGITGECPYCGFEAWLQWIGKNTEHPKITLLGICKNPDCDNKFFDATPSEKTY